MILLLNCWSDNKSYRWVVVKRREHTLKTDKTEVNVKQIFLFLVRYRLCYYKILQKICMYCSYSLKQTVCRSIWEHYQSWHIELYANILYRPVTITCAAAVFRKPGASPPSLLSLFGSSDAPPIPPSIFSVLRAGALLLRLFGRKPRLFVNYAIKIYKAEEAFMVSLLKAGDVSWHHHARDDWWELRLYFMLCQFSGEYGCNEKIWEHAWLLMLNWQHKNHTK